jgi:hypothetical protein
MAQFFAFLIGVPLGALLLLVFGPVVRFSRYIIFAPFAPLRAWNAMADTNYRGLVTRTFWWGAAILVVMVIASDSAGDMTAKFWAWGTLVGFVLARVGYGIWDRNRIPGDGFFG